MEDEFDEIRLGDAVVTKIPELALDGVEAGALFPDSEPAAVAAATRDMGAGSVDPRTGALRLSVHAWLVRTPSRVVLIDTGAGNGKDRREQGIFDHLETRFLDHLRRAGVTPDDVDVVLHTHLHSDHVGWNTRLVDGRWTPTFRRARHVFSARERAYNAALTAADGDDEAIRAEAGLGPMARTPLQGVFADSVQPVIDAGLAHEILVDETEAIPGFTFLRSPGHSIDHASIRFVANGMTALFWGDVMHHPVQLAHPAWNSVYCEFPDAAARSRQWAIRSAAETDALVFTTHFAESSAGRVVRNGGGFTWQFVGR